MYNTAKQPRPSPELPEPVMQEIIKERMKGNEHWMHPDRARYEIQLRFAQRRGLAWTRAWFKKERPDVHKVGIDASIQWENDQERRNPSPPSYPKRPNHYSSEFDEYTSRRFMEILKENIAAGKEDIFEGTIHKAHEEATKLGLKYHDW